MRNIIILSLALLALSGAAYCALPVWYANHTFSDSTTLFVPSLRGYPPLIECMGPYPPVGEVFYYDEFSDEWVDVGGGSGYCDLRMYGTGGVMLFAGAFSTGSFSDGIWRWTAGTSPEIEYDIFMPSFLDVYPGGSCWITGTNGGFPEVYVKYHDTGEWGISLPESLSSELYVPIDAVIVSPETLYLLTETALAVSFDGGYNWDFLFGDIFGLETYSPSDMAYDFETGIIYIATWGGLLITAAPFGVYEIDTACGYGAIDIEIAEFSEIDTSCGYDGTDNEIAKLSGEKWLLLLGSDAGYLLACPVAGSEWEDWTSSLPAIPISAELVGFGSKGDGAAVVFLVDTIGEVYFADILLTGIKEAQIPEKLLLSISPNPFNSSCAITAPAGAEVEIYDLRGNVVNKPSGAFGATSLIKGGKDEAPTPVPLNKGDVAQRQGVYIWTPDETIASGIYLIKALTEDGQTATKRIMYLK